MATGRVPTTANSPLTAKGDLFGYSTTQARVAVGSDGDTLVADSAATTGLRWQGNFAAAKNKILNSDFSIWQRGTSFSNPSAGTFVSDRFLIDAVALTGTVSRQTFTLGAAPVSGYEGQYFLRLDVTSGSQYTELVQRIEDVRTFAGQSVTLSFWARLNSGSSGWQTNIVQNFGTGGSPSSASLVNQTSFTPTSSWQRFTVTFTMSSISGKTLGTNNNSYVYVSFQKTSSTASQLDIWGVQLEAGNVATAFQTATGTLQGELAACKYYYNELGGVSDQYFATGLTYSTTVGEYALTYPPMRTTPSASVSAAGDFKALNGAAAAYTNTAISFAYLCATSAAINGTIGTANFTIGQASILKAGNASAKIKLSAEL
jgi:hypothetical protein